MGEFASAEHQDHRLGLAARQGHVYRVSADVTQDPKTGLSYYTARIRVSETERGRLGELRLVPGMPVEALDSTGERNVLSYLTKPMGEQDAKA